MREENLNKIKDLYYKIVNNKKFPYIVIFLLALAITLPLFGVTISEMNEFRIHIMRGITTKETIEEGIFPPLLNAKSMNGFAYGINIFYGPITTYIPILISLIFGNIIVSLKVFTIFAVFLSGIFMYKLIYEITNKKGAALIGSLIYMAAPYKLTDIYSRNAVGEYTAFIFIPMCLLGIYNLIHGDKKKHHYIILGVIGLILSHTITTIYMALFVAIYMLINCKKLKNKEVWKKIGIDVVIILMCTMFYLIPLIEHKIVGEYAIYDPIIMATSGDQVLQRTNTPLDWIENEFSSKELIFSFGIPLIFILLITPFIYRDIDKKYKKEYIIFWIFSIISLIMCTKIFPWKYMPSFLTIIQFAWRMNGFSLSFIALVAGINIYTFVKKCKGADHIYISLIILIFVLSTTKCILFINKYDYDKEINYEETIKKAERLSIYSVNREYLPKKTYMNLRYLEYRKDEAILIEGNADILEEIKNDFKYALVVENVQNARLELPYIFYKGYEIKINGEKIKATESKKGFIEVEIFEDGILELEYKGEIIEKIGYNITICGIIFYIVLLIIEKIKKR